MTDPASSLLAQIEAAFPVAIEGSVVRTAGWVVTAADFPAPLGAVAQIDRDPLEPLSAEVIGFSDRLTLLYPYGEPDGIRPNNRVRLSRSQRWIAVGDGLLGRVIDARGNPLDGRPLPALPERVRLYRNVPQACERPRISEPLPTGIRAIDALLTCGKGQRVGIFSGSGVGKSVLLGMMARYTGASRVVVGLIGERGREVREFIERDLGPQGLAKSVVVVATSNEPALLRIQAALTATAVAEYFRDHGCDVLLLVDSLTRFALAQREIGLSAGEPPTVRGYPPSVFALLPRLVERTGRTARGSITAFYAVLAEADDPNEPISDAIRGLLDGHIWLSRKLAGQGHYPAIDVLESLSRLMPDITAQDHRDAATTVRRLLAAYRDHEDLITIGAYRRGTNRELDVAVEMRDRILGFLRQPVEHPSTWEQARDPLLQLHQEAAERMRPQPAMATSANSGGAAGGNPSSKSAGTSFSGTTSLPK